MSGTDNLNIPLRRWKKCLVAAVLLVPVGLWCCAVVRQQSALAQAAHWGIEARCSYGIVEGIRFARASEFGDDDWKSLADFPQLERLDLTFTQVTPRSLGGLADFPCLNYLEVLVSQVTAEQEQQLRRERPRLVVAKYRLIDGIRVVDGLQ